MPDDTEQTREGTRQLNPSELAKRRADREIEAAKAMAEHEERQRLKYANMERLRAERLAKLNSTENAGDCD